MPEKFYNWMLNFAFTHHPRIQHSNLLAFGQQEMRKAGLYDSDADYDGMIPSAVTRLLCCMAIEGHSGMSHQLTMDIFTKVANWKPLTPEPTPNHIPTKFQEDM